MPGTLVGTVRGLFATANVTAQVGPVFTCNRGFVDPPLRNGGGDYTLTLQQGITLNSEGGGVAHVQAYGATPGLAAIEQVDATHLRVRMFDAAGAALEAAFGISIQDVGPQ